MFCGQLEDERNVDRFVVEEDAVAALAVFAEGLTVIGHGDDQGFVELA